MLRCREIIPAKQEGPLTLNAEPTAVYDVLAGKLEVGRPRGGAAAWRHRQRKDRRCILKLIARCLELEKGALLL